MSRVCGKNTSPEIRVRRVAHCVSETSQGNLRSWMFLASPPELQESDSAEIKCGFLER